MRSPRLNTGARFGADHRVHAILFEKFKHGECLFVEPGSERNGKETAV